MQLQGFHKQGEQAEAGTQVEAAPVRPSERIEQIDILRGIALFGVLVINLLSEFRVSIFQQFMKSPPATNFVDRWIETYIPVFVELKAFALFSLLFGIGLAIQYERLSVRGKPFYWLMRRLLALLLLGVIHLTLIWNGDILTEYAVAGLIVLPFLLLRLRWLGTAALLFAGLYIFLQYFPLPVPSPDAAWYPLHVAVANDVYKHGNFAQIISFEWHELPQLLPLHIYVLPRTVALFLFGAFCWRSGVVKRLAEHRRTLSGAALVGLIVGVSCTVLTSPLVRPGLFGKAGAAVSSIGDLGLTIGYAGVLLWMTTKDWGLRWLGWAAPLGRMAFTNYLLQSVIFSALFFGWGLGWFGMRAGPALLVGIGVYVLQVFVSAAWLRRFRFGPVEWLWRTMMYGAVQPMRRRA